MHSQDLEAVLSLLAAITQRIDEARRLTTSLVDQPDDEARLPILQQLEQLPQTIRALEEKARAQTAALNRAIAAGQVGRPLLKRLRRATQAAEQAKRAFDAEGKRVAAWLAARDRAPG